jgi:acetyltransferase-like isoleucine patch superfamily enzyme
LASRWRNLYYRALGVRISGYVWLRDVEIPRGWASITLEGPLALDRGVVLLASGQDVPGKLTIRRGTYVNRYTMFDVHHRLEVGRNCMVGPHCYLTDSNHGTSGNLGVAQRPMMSQEVILEDGVWLGAGVIVLAGVRIGSGTIVGAGSVVTRDLPENVVAVGVPARVIRSRST